MENSTKSRHRKGSGLLGFFVFILDPFHTMEHVSVGSFILFNMAKNGGRKFENDHKMIVKITVKFKFTTRFAT